MSVLLEKPLMILLAGGAVSVVVIFFWLQTGHRRLLQLFAATLLLTAILLAVAQVVETDREVVSRTLHEIAALVEANDDQAVLEFLHESAPMSRRKAEQNLNRYEFARVRIKQNLKVVVAPGQPKRATATFNAVAALTHDAEGVRANQPVPHFLTVEMVQEAGRWYVTNFQHQTAIRGFQTEDRRMR